MTLPHVFRIVALSTALMLAACTTSHLSNNYSELGLTYPVSEGAGRGKRLGYVTGEAGGFVWSGCEERARMSLEELSANAGHLGASSLGEVRWDATGTSDPGCRRSWLFLVLWPMAFTPMFMNTRVEAVAYGRASAVR
jgi:hypothetical protein